MFKDVVVSRTHTEEFKNKIRNNNTLKGKFIKKNALKVMEIHKRPWLTENMKLDGFVYQTKSDKKFRSECSKHSSLTVAFTY